MFSISEHVLPCDALSSRISDSRARPLVGYGGRDASIHIYPFSGYTRSAWLQGLTEPITALAFDPDQTAVVGGSDAGKVQLWDLASEEVVRSFTRGHNATITGIDVFRSGQFFATVSTDKVLRVWDVRKSSGRQSYKDAAAPLCAVQFSPNGKWIATGCARGVVRLYDLAAGQLVRKFELHTGAITSLHFHPDLYYLTVASGDGTVSVWDLDSFELKFRSASQHTPIDAVRFCGTHLLATSDHAVRVYDMRTLSDRTATSVEAPWMMIGDVAYAASADEAWFVETSGARATKSRLPLADLTRRAEVPPSSPATAAASSPPAATAPQRAPTATQNATEPVFREAPATSSASVASPASAKAASHTPPPQPLPSSSPRPKDSANGASAKKSTLSPSPSRPQWSGGSSGPSFPEAPPSSLAGRPASELQLVDQLSREGAMTTSTLQSRLATLSQLGAAWAEHQPAAIDHLHRLYEEGQEFGPLFDFLTVMQQQKMKEKLTSDSLLGMIDLVQIALSTDYEPLVLLGLRTLRSTVTRFRTRVEEARRRARSAQSTGYNDPLGMAQHDRIKNKLAECRPGVQFLAQRSDAVGEEARSVVTDLPTKPRPA